ncbi:MULTISPECIES: cytochrome b/b6 domain-containing protein [unclassified Novosphingobium]|uniref:cytochrome b n=1 Tax=unclassified Novosphingobium TaxID=2644732 RepID=UPI00146AD338|nr:MULTISPECIES: cytochrome b/b6 domain-containing protein [unclassified Novosphingobium]NMN04843.1 cytochrome b561 [Novosphingobium sp. SG919]NMN85163.1 cytochrome b561 [Novosphingobium sp. SG916]
MSNQNGVPSLDYIGPQGGISNARYSRVAMILHWSIALFIVFNLSLGYFMEGFAMPFRLIVVGLHISAGLTVLALTLVRVVWRLSHAPPPYPDSMTSWERHAAHYAHFMLYAAMVLMPLTGWAIISSHPRPGSPGAIAEAMRHPMPPMAMTASAKGSPGAGAPPRKFVMKIWYVLPVPVIAPIEAIGEHPGGLAAQQELHEKFVHWHGTGGYILIGLLILHILGALKHQVLDKQPELARMGIGKRVRSPRKERAADHHDR